MARSGFAIKTRCGNEQSTTRCSPMTTHGRTLMTSATSWIEEFITAVNADALSDEDRETILMLAGVAAPSSERTAAPLTCWVAAAAGLSPLAALEIANSLARQQRQDDP